MKKTALVSANSQPPTFGVGACLVGQKVRYNGDAKKPQAIIEQLKQHAQFQSFCPEVAIGLGVPRPTLRLVEKPQGLILTDSEHHQENYTQAMLDYGQKVLQEAPNLCAYILVKGSPSCGYQRVKRYNDEGHSLKADAEGFFTKSLRLHEPLLPMEDEGRLNDPAILESFLSRAYTYHHWKLLTQQGITLHLLIEFWARYKYLLMAHDIEAYKQCGRILAKGKQDDLTTKANDFITTLMQGLQKPATRKKRSNVLQHIQGYLKNHISNDDKQELIRLIDQYREGIVPLVVPMILLQHHFKTANMPYINQQVFMQPYPENITVRNQL